MRENIYIKTLTDRLLKRPTPSSPLNLAHAASGECYVRECMAGMCLSENGGGPDESAKKLKYPDSFLANFPALLQLTNSFTAIIDLAM